MKKLQISPLFRRLVIPFAFILAATTFYSLGRYTSKVREPSKDSDPKEVSDRIVPTVDSDNSEEVYAELRIPDKQEEVCEQDISMDRYASLFQVSGVMITDSGNTAIINDKVVKVGDTIDGYLVVAINEYSVDLEDDEIILRYRLGEQQSVRSSQANIIWRSIGLYPPGRTTIEFSDNDRSSTQVESIAVLWEPVEQYDGTTLMRIVDRTGQELILAYQSWSIAIEDKNELLKYLSQKTEWEKAEAERLSVEKKVRSERFWEEYRRKQAARLAEWERANQRRRATRPVERRPVTGSRRKPKRVLVFTSGYSPYMYSP